MIPITPGIIGPGIEEEYADATAAISDLRRALGARTLTNDTPDGRLLLELAWLEQEIKRQQLSIPVDRSYAGTVYYLAGSGELDRVPGVRNALSRLYVVLQGIGLLKSRHIPVLISILEDFLHDVRERRDVLNADQLRDLDDLSSEADLIRSDRWPSYRPPNQQFNNLDAPNIKGVVPRAFYRLQDINNALYEGWRPVAARKPPLPAPVPGLLPQAPLLPDTLKNQIP